ncbi:helix-turn-helix domain-containing protein [Roseibium sediminis]|uniref:helix-turn-helix domain-containing protein n=1 Tax=Roseibium sediminis TaxID=1775174 RepID=UPI00123D53A6|nr:helix-turn-helix domain-containing protein [Roseibium sediminis]
MTLIFSGDLSAPGAERELVLCGSLVTPRNPKHACKVIDQTREVVVGRGGGGPRLRRPPGSMPPRRIRQEHPPVKEMLARYRVIVPDVVVDPAGVRAPSARDGLAYFAVLNAVLCWARFANSGELLRCEDVLLDVCTRHNTSLCVLRGAQRTKAVVSVRQEAMYLMRVQTAASLPQIGRMLHRDHTSVLHGSEMHALRNNLPMPWKCGGRLVR